MSAEAIPSDQGGEYFPSTMMPEEQVSAIRAPMDESSEVVPSVGNSNSIDPYFYLNFVSIALFSWSTTDKEGKILYKVPIHPYYSHNNLSYLSRLYNVWAGGFDYMAKVAGTGFHAGALGMARIPPNIDPDTITGVEQFTIFENEIIDPKRLSPISKHIPDQKPIKYHYSSFNSSDPNTFGGWLVVYVSQQLNTSSGGTNTIDIRVYTKASPDFTLDQMIPVANNVSSEPPELAFADLFENLNEHRSPFWHLSTCSDITILPTNIGSYTSGTDGVTGLDGNTLSGVLPAWTATKGRCPSNYDASIEDFFAHNIANSMVGESEPVQLSGTVTSDSEAPAGTTSNGYTGALLPDGVTVDLADPTGWAGGFNAGNVRSVVPIGSFTPAEGEPIVSFVNGESFLVFSFLKSSSDTTLSANDVLPDDAFYQAATTQEIATMIKNSNVDLPSNTALLFQLFDTNLQLPLGNVKLYPSGYFTTNGINTTISYSSANLKLVYVGLTPLISTIPGNNEFSQTLMAHANSRKSPCGEFRASMKLKK